MPQKEQYLFSFIYTSAPRKKNYAAYMYGCFLFLNMPPRVARGDLNKFILNSAFCEHFVYKPVSKRLVCGKVVIPVRVAFELLYGFARVCGKNFVEPLAPLDNRNAPMDAAMPMQIVDTSHLT